LIFSNTELKNCWHGQELNPQPYILDLSQVSLTSWLQRFLELESSGFYPITWEWVGGKLGNGSKVGFIGIEVWGCEAKYTLGSITIKAYLHALYDIQKFLHPQKIWTYTRSHDATKKRIGTQAIGNRTDDILQLFETNWLNSLDKHHVRIYLKKIFFKSFITQFEIFLLKTFDWQIFISIFIWIFTFVMWLKLLLTLNITWLLPIA